MKKQLTLNQLNTVCPAWAVFILAAGMWLAGAPASNAALSDGLVEYWEFDGDYSAQVTADHAGTLTTTGTGSGTFVSGKFGQGIDLENSVGNQAYVVIGGNENDFDFAGGSMSFSVWYTTESLYTAYQCLLGKGENAAWRVARVSTTGTNIKLSVAGASGNGQIALQDGSWHHVVGTYDATNGTRLYVDGSQVGSTAAAYNLQNVGTAMQIGGNPQAAGRGWDGIMDDVAVWNRVLTAEEVSSIWNDGAGASIRSLIGAGSESFAVTIASDVTGLDLAWESRAGKLYNVRGSTDLFAAVTNWTLVATNLAATTPLNTRNVPASDPLQFFVIEEYPAPPVLVQNAGFEANALADGIRTNSPSAWTKGYYNLITPTVWVVADSGAGVYNPDAAQGYGGVAPEGQNVMYATAYLGFDSGLSQGLATKVETNRQYDLSVLVGNPFALNGNQPTANYRIELLAGEVLLASATGPSPMDDSVWTNVTVSYRSGASPGQLGQALEIRLLAQDDFDGLQVDFDQVTLTITPVEPAPVFSEDFESGGAGWTTGSDGAAGTAWELGVPETVGPPAAHSPTNCYGTNLRGNYGLNANVWLRSPAINLTTAPSATLKFWQYTDIEVQFDSGSLRILDASNDSELAVIEARVEGVTANWTQYSAALPAAAVGKQIKIEFRLQSDSLDSYAGWYIDDVVVLVP